MDYVCTRTNISHVNRIVKTIVASTKFHFSRNGYNPAYVRGFSRQSSGCTSLPIKKRQFVIITCVMLFERTVNGIFEEEITPRVLSNLSYCMARANSTPAFSCILWHRVTFFYLYILASIFLYYIITNASIFVQNYIFTNTT